MKSNQGAQYEISIDGVPRNYRDRQDIALQTARFLKSRNPHSVVKLKDLQTGEETVVAFKSGTSAAQVRRGRLSAKRKPRRERPRRGFADLYQRANSEDGPTG